MRSAVLSVLTLAVLLTSLPLAAQEEAAAAGGVEDGGAEDGGTVFLAALRADFDRAAGKLTQLGEAIPAEKYGWRPSEEVRSVGEQLVHVAVANFGLGRALGVEIPEDLPDLGQLESEVTEKDDVLALLERSLDHARSAFDATPVDQLGDPVKIFGGELPAARVLIQIAAHGHEHLGNLIAYARANGVVPPWSASASGG
jgi:uncharacterized damage-inducible protein DinB